MIRQFHPKDAVPCCQVIHACLENDASFSHALRQRLRSGETPEKMAERARLFYLAVWETEGAVLGVAGLDMNEIRLLCVSPAHQRRGIGRSLLDHIKEMIPGSLFADIFVYASPQAADFYRACGFIEGGSIDFDIGGESMHTIFMTFQTRSM